MSLASKAGSARCIRGGFLPWRRASGVRIQIQRSTTPIGSGSQRYSCTNPSLSLSSTPNPNTSVNVSTIPGTSTSTDKSARIEVEESPLPLPRALSPSKGLFLLSLPIAPEHWPSHLDLYSTLYRKTTKLLKPHGLAVNCVYDGHSQSTSFDVIKGKEEYPARLIRGDSRVVEYPSFSIEMIDQVKRDLDTSHQDLITRTEQVQIMVCTHGSRDCRCSDRGGALVNALREEVVKRGLESRIKVGEIAHVGGHKYAANAVVLPALDMYSNLWATDASAMIDHLLSTTTTPTIETSASPVSQSLLSHENRRYRVSSPFWAHWRGRYGSTEEAQSMIWSVIDPTAPASSTSRLLDLDPSFSSQSASPIGEKKKVSLMFKTFEGENRLVSAFIGDNLLNVARREDLPSMEGTCGGNLECSTCHLYIDPSAPIPEPKDEELDMLDYALGYREGQSRLGCQIRVDEALVRWCESGGELKLPRY